jgi:CheY-like chemotaxis protein
MTVEEERQHGLEHGAFSYMVKPITTDGLEVALDRVKEYASRRTKKLLIVEDNEAERMSVMELLGHDDVEIQTASTGAEALAALRAAPFDGVVLDLRLPDTSGFELLEEIQAEPALRDVPVIVFTGKELNAEEENRLRTVAKSIVIKGVQSPERLLDETALFLHRVVTNLPPEKQRMLERLHQTDEALQGKKVLVVDDDVRNIFALSSVLERHGMTVVTANTGKKAIGIIESDPGVSLVLMDIMMPEMDGYETMGVIRQKPEFKKLPILALTAKAMKGDREKCLQAGASDYIAKPVNTDQLLSLMRVWLHQ